MIFYLVTPLILIGASSLGLIINPSWSISPFIWVFVLVPLIDLALPYLSKQDPDLKENQYIVQIDNRLGRLVTGNGAPTPVNFIDDDNIAYYTGFIYCSFGRPYGCVITGNKISTISANIDASQPWRRSHCDNVIYTDWKRDNFLKAIVSIIGRDDPPKNIGKSNLIFIYDYEKSSIKNVVSKKLSTIELPKSNLLLNHCFIPGTGSS